MTGGAFKNSSNLLSRRREIEEFEKTVSMLKADMDGMEQQVNEVKSRRAACYTEIDEIQQSLTKASVVENTARMNLEQARLRQLEAKQRLDAYAGEQADLDAQLGEITDNEDSIQMELETSQNLEKAWNEKLNPCRNCLRVKEKAKLSR